MIYSIENHCKWCIHYTGGRACKAFPEKIPDELWSGENLHYEPVDGDNGFRFKKKRVELTLDN